MNITREFLEKRIANLKASHAEHAAAANQHQTMVHTLNGAIQDATHMLAVFDGKVPATGDVPNGTAQTGVTTDVAMEAEVGKKEGVH